MSKPKSGRLTKNDRIMLGAARELDAGNESIRKGQAIAIGFLDDLGAVDERGRTKGDDCCLDATYRRPGVRFDNVLLRYLDRLREEGDREVEAGFCSVVSDYIGTCAVGAIPDVGQYANFLSLAPARLRWSRSRGVARLA